MLGTSFAWLILSMSSPSSAAQAPATRPAAPPTRPASPAPQAATQGSGKQGPPVYDPSSLAPEYRIAPGDVLQVLVWKEPDLSREVRVRTDGFLTVPLLGEVSAVGKTPRALAAELGDQLAQLVTSPVVTVTLVSSSALRFFVVGQVHKAGEFPLVGQTTVMQALALAGGFQEYAKTDEIKILRQGLTVTDGRVRTLKITLAVNYKALAQGQNLAQDVPLMPGDVIVVP